MGAVEAVAVGLGMDHSLISSLVPKFRVEGGALFRHNAETKSRAEEISLTCHHF